MPGFNRGPMYCRNCEAHEIKTEIYFDNVHKSQSGKSIPLEKSTGQPHKCPYSPYALKQKAEEDFIEGRGYMEKPQQMSSHEPSIESQRARTEYPISSDHKGDFLSERIDVIEGQIQRLIERSDSISLMVKAIGARQELAMEGDSDKRDRMQLLQRIAELEDVLKKKGLVQKASEIKSEGTFMDDTDPRAQMIRQKEDMHREILHKNGQTDEELDLTE